jgi:hypothetical protein
MRNIALGIVAAVAVTAGLSAPAAAQRYNNGGFATWDLNRDGRIDAYENRAARRNSPPNRNGGYSPYDFNRDGRVDARENQAAIRDQGYDRYDRYDDYDGYDDYDDRYESYSPSDLNHDGRVTRREMRQAQRMQRSW